ncbi:hypothetical protein LXL04_009381 [Taraxacum kok-saghyz]
MSSNNNNQNLPTTPENSQQQGYHPVMDPTLLNSSFLMSPMSNYPLSPIQQQHLFQTLHNFSPPPQSQSQQQYHSQQLFQSQQQFQSQQFQNQQFSSQQFQTHPETQQLNVIPDDDDEDEAKPEGELQQRKGRAPTKKWTHEEEKMLAMSWCDISEDQVKGKYQSKDQFWERGYAIQRDLHKLLQSTVKWRKRGVNLEKKTKDTFHQDTNGVFKFEHVWELVRNNSKWLQLETLEKLGRTSKRSKFSIPIRQHFDVDLNSTEDEISGTRERQRGPVF